MPVFMSHKPFGVPVDVTQLATSADCLDPADDLLNSFASALILASTLVPRRVPLDHVGPNAVLFVLMQGQVQTAHVQNETRVP